MPDGNNQNPVTPSSNGPSSSPSAPQKAPQAAPAIPQPVQVQAAAVQPVVGQAAPQTVQASAQPTVKQAVPPRAPQSVQRPGMAGGLPPVRKPPNPKRLIYGALGCLGCSVFLLILFVLIFASQTSPTGDNALAKVLGLDPGSFINILIIIVNIIFLLFALVLFLIAMVGIFRTAMARKDDKETRKKNLKLAGVSGGLLLLLIFIWIAIYVFLSAKKFNAPTPTKTAIVTDPVNTLGLTAPVEIKFDGTKLGISSRYELISFLWDFDDGETSTVQSPSHTYKNMGKNNGRYDVKLTVTVRDKTTSEEKPLIFNDTVVISNVQIHAEYTATPDTGAAPLAVKFDASASSAPAGEIQKYEWDFNNTKSFKDATGVTTNHTFDQPGTYTVNLRVTDNTGQQQVYSYDIVVQGPNLPTAVIEIPTSDGHYFVGQQYNFMGEKSTSPVGNITKYEWDFGDQTPKATTRTVNHTYKAAGDYEVTLAVTDNKGGKGQLTQKITVETPTGAPLPAFTTIPAPAKTTDGFIAGTVPFEVTFDGSPSSEANGSIVDYHWDFNGDGTQDSAGKQVTYVFKDAGTYNATLTVVDAQNKQASTLLVVKALAQALQTRITADPVEGVVPLTVTFDASGSSYPNGKIVSYEWDFGDGSPKRIDVAKVVYKYTQIGTFTAKVTAIASDNSKGTAFTPVNVRPVPLKSCFETSTAQGPAPLTLEFDPRCSTGTISKYSWDFGDGETSKTRKPTHTFTNPGSYEVKLEVSDNQNVIDSFSMNILVTGNVNP